MKTWKSLLVAGCLFGSLASAQTVPTPPVKDQLGQGGAKGDGAMSGGYSGGGGDRLRGFSDGAAWFNGSNRKIRVCQDVASDFGKSMTDTRASVEKAFGIWKDYLTKKKLYDGNHPALGFTLQLDFQNACDGSEDLKFYFGTRDESVEQGLKAYVDPVAMAVRTEYHREQMWARGFVWVAKTGEKNPVTNYPDWSGKNRLLGILLHELGHVFGCDHVPGTIMDEGIVSMLSQSDLSSPMLAQIDITRELYRCDSCAMKVQGHIEVWGDPEGNTEHENVRTGRLYKQLFGRPIENEMYLDLEKAEKSNTYRLSFFSHPGRVLSKSFEIVENSFTLMDGPYVFRMAYGPWKTNQSRVIYASMTASDGTKIPIVMEYNILSYTASWPAFGSLLKISGFIDGQKAPLANFRVEIPPYWLEN
jgi:hypothetical protein